MKDKTISVGRGMGKSNGMICCKYCGKYPCECNQLTLKDIRKGIKTIKEYHSRKLVKRINKDLLSRAKNVSNRTKK